MYLRWHVPDRCPVLHANLLYSIPRCSGASTLLIQTRLFERLRNGYVTTEAGEVLRRTAEQCEPLFAEAERRIVGGDTRLTGSLQISTGFVIAQHLLPPALKVFRNEYPDIEVEIQTAREQVDLARRDADIAIRFAARVPDYLVGRKLGIIRFRIYAWNDAPFLQRPPKKPAIQTLEHLVSAYPWICLGRDARERPYDRWMHKHVPDSSVVMRADHFPTSLALLREGLGVALLPEFMADGMNDLVALSAPIEELQSPLWILTHPDLRNTARVRAFMQVVGTALDNLLSNL